LDYLFGDFGASWLHTFLLHDEPDVTTLLVARVIQKLSGAEHKSDPARHRTLGHWRPFGGVAFSVIYQQAVVFLFRFAAL